MNFSGKCSCALTLCFSALWLQYSCLWCQWLNSSKTKHLVDILNLVLLSLSWCETFVDFGCCSLRLLKEVMIEWALKCIFLNSINLCLPLNVLYRTIRNLHLLTWRKKWDHMILALHYKKNNKIGWINCTHAAFHRNHPCGPPAPKTLPHKGPARCHSPPSEGGTVISSETWVFGCYWYPHYYKVWSSCLMDWTTKRSLLNTL